MEEVCTANEVPMSNDEKENSIGDIEVDMALAKGFPFGTLLHIGYLRDDGPTGGL